jgi:pimeloyl-ACP methyl ester carboxylesterase
MRFFSRSSRFATVFGAAAVTVALTAATASASTLPVNYDFGSGFVATFGSPGTAPPGANNFNCQPSAAHPFPVILVHGTFENQNDNWQAAAPLLANHGYCVFTFNYGGGTASDSVQGTGEIAASAQQLESFVDQVLAATGAAKVDLVGHSQGGMMPRYYINNLGGAAFVDKLIGLAPSNYGTTLDGLTTLGQSLGVLTGVNSLLSGPCAACVEQEVGSPFLAALNANPTVSAVKYTVIESKNDEVVTPYTNAFLPSAPNVTNITVQNQCPLDQSDHLEIAADPVALADVLNALDPTHRVHVPCLLVLPVTGPVGPVPSF